MNVLEKAVTKRGRKEVIRRKKLCGGCSNDKFDEKGKKRKFKILRSIG